MSQQERRGNPIARLSLFLRQVVAELRKVVWPTRPQLITYFWVVLVFVIVVMTLVSLLDLGFGKLAFSPVRLGEGRVGVPPLRQSSKRRAAGPIPIE